MRIAATLAMVSSTFLLGACAYHRPPVVYTTPGGQVISAGADARSAADRALETSLHAEVNQYGDLGTGNPNLQIHANNGSVTLSGPVRNERDRQMVETLVRNTPGVVTVNDQLQVLYPPTGVVTPPVYSSGAPVYPPPVVAAPVPVPRIDAVRVTDQPLANRIADELRAEALAPGMLQNVNIRVENGAAYLLGYVSTQQEREAIDTAVQRVRGVTAVYDQLQVR